MAAKVKMRIARKINLLAALGILLVALLAFGCFGGAAGTNSSSADADEELAGVEFVRQVVGQDNRSERTVMWQSEESLSDPAVEYREADGASGLQIVEAATEKFADDGKEVVLYTARLTGLPQGRAYEYRLVGNGARGVWHKLRTSDGGDCTALIFPDSQSSDYSGWRQLAQDAAARNPQAKFFISMGDLVDNGEDHWQWEAWFDAVSGIIDRIPVAPLMGNHETYSRQWQVRSPVAYLREFAVPDNGSAQHTRYYYSFDYGPVHFIVLNTQQSELAELAPELMAEQLAWFRQDVAAADEPWKVVLMHRDPLQYRIAGRPERLEGFSDEGVIWMPLFDELDIDVVLSAHLHTYRNRGHIKNFARSEDGPLYILTGVAGDVRYPNLWLDHALDEYVAPQPETNNYMMMKATADVLYFYAYLPDGTELDQAMVRK